MRPFILGLLTSPVNKAYRLTACITTLSTVKQCGKHFNIRQILNDECKYVTDLSSKSKLQPLKNNTHTHCISILAVTCFFYSSPAVHNPCTINITLKLSALRITWGSLFYVAYTAGLFTDPSAWWQVAEPFQFAINQGPHLLDQCTVVNIRFNSVHLQVLEMAPFS